MMDDFKTPGSRPSCNKMGLLEVMTTAFTPSKGRVDRAILDDGERAMMEQACCLSAPMGRSQCPREDLVRLDGRSPAGSRV